MKIDREKLSPMMQNYMQTKEEYADCLLFYRLGDFYELFFDDAKLVSKELSLTLTGRDCGLEERAPMCGVPYHALDGYLNQLVQKGYKVAICDQVEDPATAKGIVKREVTRVATPGTNLDMQSIDASRNQYLLCVFYRPPRFGIAVCDVTTGEFYATRTDSLSGLLDEFAKYEPSEVIYNSAFAQSGVDFDFLSDQYGSCFFELESWMCDEDEARRALLRQFKVASEGALGLEGEREIISAGGAMVQYLAETQMRSLDHIAQMQIYRSGDYMLLDAASRRNLELCETMRQKEKKGSLFWVLDRTKTAMGARLLRQYIEQPLTSRAAIESRLDAVGELLARPLDRAELQEYLNPVYDLERLASKVAYRSANPRDMLALADSMAMLPPIRGLLAGFDSRLTERLYEQIDGLEDICERIRACIADDPPLTIREGGIIRDGYDEDIDLDRNAKNEGTGWLASLEEKERERTGIKKLRIRYNKVFGYFIEVTNSYKDLVPEDYVRKQTLTNAERYITPSLKEVEDRILGAQERLTEREYQVFCDLRDETAAALERILRSAHALAALDVLVSLADVAEREHYTRPSLVESGSLVIRDGRHPVVEKMMPPQSFIANDAMLDQADHRFAIITGPNMAGKSTYMRQTALIVLMAQIGSFVPASSAEIPIVDKIFTRVGASDDLASGQSTFMVEMTEVANILRNATPDSLIILDEIGRGTSTYDGLSIAWAVAEYICDRDRIGAKTLFATHYHEMTELEGKLAGVVNYRIDVREEGKNIVFLRKIVKGGASRSYGIQVARLAGLPDAVLDRAGQILAQLIDSESAQMSTVPARSPSQGAWELALSPQEREVLNDIDHADLTAMTPLEALNFLDGLKKKLGER